MTTKEIDGDVSIGRNVSAGGQATIRGSVTIGHNLKVDGWLDAPNIKCVNKGMYKTYAELCTVYPVPHSGWWAVVTDENTDKNGYLGRIYLSKGSGWIAATTATGAPMYCPGPTVDNAAQTAIIEALAVEVTRVDGRVDEANLRIGAAETKLNKVQTDLHTVSGDLQELDGKLTAEVRERKEADADLDRKIATAQAKAEDAKLPVIPVSDLDTMGTGGGSANILSYLYRTKHAVFLVGNTGGNRYVNGVLEVVVDSLSHCITQTLRTNFTVDSSGVLGTAHDHDMHTWTRRMWLDASFAGPSASVGTWEPWRSADAGIESRMAALSDTLKDLIHEESEDRQRADADLRASHDALEQRYVDTANRLQQDIDFNDAKLTAEVRERKEADADLDAKVTRNHNEVTQTFGTMGMEVEKRLTGLWDELDNVKDLIAHISNGEVERCLRMLGYDDEDISHYIQANLNYDLGITMEDLQLSAYRWTHRAELDPDLWPQYEMAVMPKWTEAMEAVETEFESPLALQMKCGMSDGGEAHVGYARYAPFLCSDKAHWQIARFTCCAGIDGTVSDLYTFDYHWLRYIGSLFLIDMEKDKRRLNFFYGQYIEGKVEIQGLSGWIERMFLYTKFRTKGDDKIDLSGIKIPANLTYISEFFTGDEKNYTKIVLNIGEWDFSGVENNTIRNCFKYCVLKNPVVTFGNSWASSDRLYSFYGFCTRPVIIDGGKFTFLDRWDDGHRPFVYHLGTGIDFSGAPTHMYFPNQYENPVNATLASWLGYGENPVDRVSPNFNFNVILHLPRIKQFSPCVHIPVRVDDLGANNILSFISFADTSNNQMVVPIRRVVINGIQGVENDFDALKASMLTWFDRAAHDMATVTVRGLRPGARGVSGEGDNLQTCSLRDALDDDFMATMAARGYTIAYEE